MTFETSSKVKFYELFGDAVVGQKQYELSYRTLQRAMMSIDIMTFLYKLVGSSRVKNERGQIEAKQWSSVVDRLIKRADYVFGALRKDHTQRREVVFCVDLDKPSDPRALVAQTRERSGGNSDFVGFAEDEDSRLDVFGEESGLASVLAQLKPDPAEKEELDLDHRPAYDKDMPARAMELFRNMGWRFNIFYPWLQQEVFERAKVPAGCALVIDGMVSSAAYVLSPAEEGPVLLFRPPEIKDNVVEADHRCVAWARSCVYRKVSDPDSQWHATVNTNDGDILLVSIQIAGESVRLQKRLTVWHGLGPRKCACPLDCYRYGEARECVGHYYDDSTANIVLVSKVFPIIFREFDSFQEDYFGELTNQSAGFVDCVALFMMATSDYVRKFRYSSATKVIEAYNESYGDAKTGGPLVERRPPVFEGGVPYYSIRMHRANSIYAKSLASKKREGRFPPVTLQRVADHAMNVEFFLNYNLCQVVDTRFSPEMFPRGNPTFYGYFRTRDGEIHILSTLSEKGRESVLSNKRPQPIAAEALEQLA